MSARPPLLCCQFFFRFLGIGEYFQRRSLLVRSVGYDRCRLTRSYCTLTGEYFQSSEHCADGQQGGFRKIKAEKNRKLPRVCLMRGSFMRSFSARGPLNDIIATEKVEKKKKRFIWSAPRNIIKFQINLF